MRKRKCIRTFCHTPSKRLKALQSSKQKACYVPNQVPVRVIGLGISGLTCIKALSLLCPFVKIEGYEVRKTSYKPVDRGLGIWPNARRVLFNLGIMETNFFMVPPAHYQDAKGRLVSRASWETANEIRVGLIRENTLIEHLLAELDEMPNVKLHYGELPEDVHPMPMEVVVGADGIQSSVRRYMSKNDFIAVPNGVLTIQGISTFEGIGDAVSEPFEAFGPRNTRIAIVPMGSDEVSWIFTCATMDIARMEDDHIGILEDIYQFCKANFKDQLISGVISKTQPDAIVHYPILVTRGEECLQVVAPQLKTEWLSNGGWILIGDALHTIPPNLAQGASVGIEEAWEFAYALATSWGPNKEGLLDPASMAETMDRFEERRWFRRRGYNFVTNVTRLICWSPVIQFLVRATPPPFNAMFFDYFLKKSMGSGYRIPMPDFEDLQDLERLDEEAFMRDRAIEELDSGEQQQQVKKKEA